MFPSQNGTFKGLAARALKSPDRPCQALFWPCPCRGQGSDRRLFAPCPHPGPHFFPDTGLSAPCPAPVSIFSASFFRTGVCPRLVHIPVRIVLRFSAQGCRTGRRQIRVRKKDEQKTQTGVPNRVRTTSCPEKNADRVRTDVCPGLVQTKKMRTGEPDRAGQAFCGPSAPLPKVAVQHQKHMPPLIWHMANTF